MTAPEQMREDVVRHEAGETVCGFEVAAWRSPVRKPADCPQEKWDGVFPTGAGNTYAEHWSTPGTLEWNEGKVERLFTEAQLREALSTRPATDELVEALERLTFECGDYGHMTMAGIAQESVKYPGARIAAEIQARKALRNARGAL